MSLIDLRSDTITRPTPSMRIAIAGAEVGDDVFGEDPTVNRLESIAAEKMGMEAGIFLSSGTMGNLVSQMVHCQRGDEILLGNLSHVFLYEQGGSAAIAGVHSYPLPNLENGEIPIEAIEGAIRPDNIHYPRTRLIILENTHNRCMGMPLTFSYLEKVKKVANENGIKIHMDGARVFNASVALGTDVKEISKMADSISFCLSKGLGAPVGSCLCGSQAFIKSARKIRKILGGGMRQAGIMAAAGLLALSEMVDRLHLDHENAGYLASELNGIEGLSVPLHLVKTNIIYITITDPGVNTDHVVRQLGEEGIHVLKLGKREIRAVTHYHITREEIERAVRAFRKVMRFLRQT